MSKFEAIATHVRKQIHSGQLKPGDRLLSTAQLKREFGASYGTIRSALLVLKAEHLVEGRQGIGVFVAAGNHASENPAVDQDDSPPPK